MGQQNTVLTVLLNHHFQCTKNVAGTSDFDSFLGVVDIFCIYACVTFFLKIPIKLLLAFTFFELKVRNKYHLISTFIADTKLFIVMINLTANFCSE